jgi:hypothetical protein
MAKASCIAALFGSIAACTTITSPDEASMFPEETVTVRGKNYAVDTSSLHFNNEVLTHVQQQQEDTHPVAWGRYIINRGGTSLAKLEQSGSRELTASELNLFRTEQVPFFPIVVVDQGTLAGKRDAGEALAEESAIILFGALIGFGKTQPSTELLVFLDVEMGSPISPDFLLGWCRGTRNASIAGVRLSPAVYASAGDEHVREVLVEIKDQCKLGGLWLAAHRSTSSAVLPGAWRNMRRKIGGALTPIPEEIPIYMWQYCCKPGSGSRFDWNMVDPRLEELFKQQTLRLW